MGLMVTAFATPYKAGDLISVDFINKLLDITVSTGNNIYSASLSGGGSINVQTGGSTNWLSSCSKSGDDVTCNINTTLLSLNNAMTCTASRGGLNFGSITIQSTSTSAIVIKNSSSPDNDPTHLMCQLTGSDFNPDMKLKDILTQKLGFVFPTP